MNSFALSNGLSVPAAGFGTWRLGTSDATEAVVAAIKTGYRHIDCAMVYGNEAEVGQGLTNAFKEGLVKREELFVTSKLWNTDHAPKDVEAACRKTLADLGLEYLDLYLVHWAVSFEHGEELEPLDETGLAKLSFVPLQETWHAMEALVEKGLVKSIGVANYNATLLIDLLSYAKIKPVTNQVELHPYHTQEPLLKFCKSQDVAVTAYSPLGSTGAIVLDDPVIKEIAGKHNKTAAQVVLRWSFQRGTAAIPKTAHAKRITENFNIFDFALTPEDMRAISALDKKTALCDPISWWGYPYF